MQVLISHYKNLQRKGIKGFILPFTMLITVLVLLVTSTSMTLLSKQLYFSKLYRQSQAAYYAADDALACTLNVDDTYQGTDGLGIFPSSTSTDAFTYMENVITYINEKRVDLGLTDIVSLNTIKCGQAEIFKTGASSYSKFATSSSDYAYHYDDGGTPAVEYGISSMFTMRMDLGVDPASISGAHLFRCAKVTVNKTPSFRQIIAQGYATCDNLNTSVERAVVNTTRF